MPSPVAPVRCPSCGAARKPAAPWCTQCYADLRAAPAPPVRSGAPDVPRPQRAPSGWPCTTCGLVNELARPTCAACGTAFLAALRDGGSAVSAGARLVRLPARRRVLLALSLAVVLAGALLLGAVLLAALLPG